jgi:hypothetical protein
MNHALALGRSRVRHPSSDETTHGGVLLLERAIAYLGVRVTPGESAGPGPAAARPHGPGLRSRTSPQARTTRRTTMTRSMEPSIGDDDLSRQRRKREARLLDRAVPDFPGVTLADVVADVLAASDDGHGVIDVTTYLVERGHAAATVQTVVDYLERQSPAAGI